MTKSNQPNNNQVLQQSCAEEMLQKAAAHCLKVNIQFNYPIRVKDEQVDLGAVLAESIVLTSGNNAAALENDLKKLDKSKGYFVRSGRNGAAGHFRFLFWDNKKLFWTMYSSQDNQYSVMNSAGVITEAATNDLIVAHGKWGKKQGEYAIHILEATMQNISLGANFLYDFRVQGIDQATNKAIENVSRQPAFYPEIEPVKSPVKSKVKSKVAPKSTKQVPDNLALLETTFLQFVLPKLNAKNHHPTLFSRFRPENYRSSGLQKRMKIMRHNASVELLRELQQLPNHADKLALLNRAKTLSVFNMHRSNFKLFGAFGRTKTVAQIDKLIKNLNRHIKSKP